MKLHPLCLVPTLGILLAGSLSLQVRAAAAPAGPGLRAAAGSNAVAVLNLDWHDAERGRPVPVRLYFPRAGGGPCPVILFSHGLGGTREGYEYLGRHWASHGYAVVHLQHLGSDDSAWRGAVNPRAALQDAAGSLTNALNRPRDVRFALDQLVFLNQTNAALRGRLDLDHVGVAGHSFGAYTVLACVGQRGALAGRSFADPRIKAGIAMSAPVPVRVTAATYADIRVPLYHLTGTRDDSPIGNTTPADRRVPFDRISAAPQLLLTLKDGDHMVFSGRAGLGRNTTQDRRHHELILASTTAFWDAWLKADTTAKTWLTDGGFAAALGDDGTLEKKSPVGNAGKPPAPK